MLQPANDSWAAVVYESAGAMQSLGTAMLIDGRRLLTCLHVVAGRNIVGERLWVTFPKAVWLGRPRFWAASVDQADADLDVALIRLDELVPPGITPAPLRSPRPRSLVGTSWWAFGFAQSRRGNSAHGLVGEGLGDGFVRLDAEQSTPYRLMPGFSGAGVWSPAFDAVVAMVVSADGYGNGEAVTVHQLGLRFAMDEISELTRWTVGDAGDIALSAWSLRADREGSRHWGPRARGVAIDSERGFRFRGRLAALRSIVAWLDRAEPDRRALVITGSPGVGKSAVLGRIVTTADASIRSQLPAEDRAVRASEGSIACAVHVKGKTALEVAIEIARAASAELPVRPEDLAAAMRNSLARRDASMRSFNVIVDALDEATTPVEARLIVTQVILPLVETCADLGVQVMVGTRRRDDEGDLLRMFGAAITTIDLDAPRFFEEADLEAYALATLQLAGDERVGNPYATDAVARPLARRIAELSERNFLIAGLVARTHGLHDDEPTYAAELRFPPTVDAALREYLRRLAPVAGVAAHTLLTALAFAKSPGLPLPLWQVAIRAITDQAISVAELTQFARSTAANFLIEASADDTSHDTAPFRLFHQALNDALLAARSQVVPAAVDERSLAQALISAGRSGSWAAAPGYLLRSLPAHALAAGLIDDLLADDEYLLYVDLRQLIPLGSRAETPLGQQRARLLRLTPQAITAAASDRVSLFSITELLEGIGRNYAARPRPTRFRAIWASTAPRAELAVLEGHSDTVIAVCAFTLGERRMLASASRDTTIRVWDAATGSCELTLRGHTSYVSGVCAFDRDDQILLASSSGDQTIRIWDASTGELLRILAGHDDSVGNVCAFIRDGEAMLASGSSDHTVRIWNPTTGAPRRTLTGHAEAVLDVCTVAVDGHDLIASSSYDGTIRIWDPETGKHLRTLVGDTTPVRGLCGFRLGGSSLLASASADHAVWVWDPLTGQQLQAIDQGIEVTQGICAFASGNRTLLACANSGGLVSIWNPATGTHEREMVGQSIWLTDICAFMLGDATMLATADDDATVRIWQVDPADQARSPAEPEVSRYIMLNVNSLCLFPLYAQARLASTEGISVRICDPATGEVDRTLTGHSGWVSSVTAFTLAGRMLLATASYDKTVCVWDPATGARRTVLNGHTERVEDVCSFTIGDQVRLASAGDDGTARIWDPGTGKQLQLLEHPDHSVKCVCAISSGEQAMLASASEHAIRIWDLNTGRPARELNGHAQGVTALNCLLVGGRPVLASASLDDTIRLWDPMTGTHLRTLAGHTGPVNGLSATAVDGRALLATASDDRTIRIWDVESGVCRMVIPVQQQATAVTWGYRAQTLMIGLGAGLLAIRVDHRRAA
jgi:WD40 repeat protein